MTGRFDIPMAPRTHFANGTIVTDLVNRASAMLQAQPSAQTLAEISDISLDQSDPCEPIPYEKARAQIDFSLYDPNVSVTEGAAALVSTAAAISDLLTVLSRTKVTRATADVTIARVLKVLSSISSALESISRAVANILTAPILVELVSATAARVIVAAATMAEIHAKALLKDASVLKSEICKRRKNLDEVPNGDQPEAASVEEYMNHRNILSSTSLVSHSEDCETRYSKKSILKKFGYTLGEIRGHGTFSVVQVARSKIHNCEVAIKIISKSHVPQELENKLLSREILVAQTLNHPNVIKLFQVIETNHSIYLVMEYAERGSLCDIIRKEKLNEHRCKRWFRQLVEAMNYCHELGIAHRDIKCENILVDAEDNVKLSEFYLARIHNVSANERSRSSTFCGTEAYTAPEVLQCTPYEPKLSDVWSLGVVLFTIVYGHLPFGKAELKYLRKKSTCKLHFPKHPKVSSRCKTLISQMLTPETCRIDIPNIRCHSWLQTSDTATPTYSSKGVEVNAAELHGVTTESESQISRFRAAMRRLGMMKVRHFSRSAIETEEK